MNRVKAIFYDFDGVIKESTEVKTLAFYNLIRIVTFNTITASDIAFTVAVIRKRHKMCYLYQW